MSAKPRRPLPLPSPLTEPYWNAARERRLVIQRCQACRRYFNPPVPVCMDCHSTRLAYEQVSGRGRIHARTIMYLPRVQGFEEVVPYAVIAVELDEQPGLLLLGNLLDAPAGEARIDTRVQVDFE